MRKDEEDASAEVSDSVARKGLAGFLPFPPVALRAPGLGRVHSWCHLVALGHGKGRGSFMFICVIIMGHCVGCEWPLTRV